MLALPLLLAAAATAVLRAAAEPQATVYTNCKVNNTVALTFDDGPYKFESARRTPLYSPFLRRR